MADRDEEDVVEYSFPGLNKRHGFFHVIERNQLARDSYHWQQEQKKEASSIHYWRARLVVCRSWIIHTNVSVFYPWCRYVNMSCNMYNHGRLVCGPPPL